MLIFEFADQFEDRGKIVVAATANRRVPLLVEPDQDAVDDIHLLFHALFHALYCPFFALASMDRKY